MSLPLEFIEFTRTRQQQKAIPVETPPALVNPDLSLSLAVTTLADYQFLFGLVKDRLTSLEKRIDLADSDLTFEFTKLAKLDLKVIPVKTLTVPKFVQQKLELKLVRLIAETNNLFVDLKEKERNSLDQLEQVADLTTSYANQLTDKNKLKAAIYSLNPVSIETTLNKHWLMLSQIEQSLTPLLVQADVDKVQSYIDLVYTLYSELVDTYYAVYTEYQALSLKHENLATRLAVLVDKCNDTYVNMLNASYIRSGDYVRVRKEDDKIYVSAWKPTPAPCEKAQPIWKKSEVVVKDNPATCPPPNSSSSSKDCDYIIEVSED